MSRKQTCLPIESVENKQDTCIAFASEQKVGGSNPRVYRDFLHRKSRWDEADPPKPGPGLAERPTQPGHDAFRHTVAEWPLGLARSADVAAGTLRVDLRGFPYNQTRRHLLVNRMAAHAAQLVFGVADLDAHRVCGLVQVTLQTSPVCLRRCELCRILDIRGRY
jgi:hypothetical protein